MSNTEQLLASRTLRGGPNSDVIGGVVTAVLGLLHLFVLQIGGTVGVLLLFVAWPLVGGAVGAALDRDRHPNRDRELPLIGALSGVFGAVMMTLVTLVVGFVGLWSGFIYATFGSGLASVTITLTMVSVITWTVFGYVGGYTARQALRAR